MRKRVIIALLSFVLLAGCQEHVIGVTVINRDAGVITNIEVDYPGAVFGIGKLNPDASSYYVIHPTKYGAVTLSWTDAAGKLHSANGPVLQVGNQGSLTIELGPENAARWIPKLAR